MKIKLYQFIILKNSCEFRTIEKSFESNIIPHKGDFIEDPFWKDPSEYEVVQITINYEENSCLVTVKGIEVDDEARIYKLVDIARLHHWKCPTLD